MQSFLLGDAGHQSLSQVQRAAAASLRRNYFAKALNAAVDIYKVSICFKTSQPDWSKCPLVVREKLYRVCFKSFSNKTFCQF